MTEKMSTRGGALPVRLVAVDTEIRQRAAFLAGTNVGLFEQLARTSLGPQPQLTESSGRAASIAVAPGRSPRVAGRHPVFCSVT
jgi:hypothetical protein